MAVALVARLPPGRAGQPPRMQRLAQFSRARMQS
jgi:hypothetical protein